MEGGRDDPVDARMGGGGTLLGGGALGRTEERVDARIADDARSGATASAERGSSRASRRRMSSSRAEAMRAKELLRRHASAT
jgi:hypothetical protein